MLFDFIAFIDTNGEATTRASSHDSNAFASLPPYSSIPHHVQESTSDYARVISLHKHPDETQSVFRSEALEVYIFGYCFPRLDSSYFAERTRLDAERIADAYRRGNTAFIEEIKGSFAILILDKANRATHLLTDPLNVRPVYYYKEKAELVIATSLSALLHHRRTQSLPVALNQPALLEYYLFEYTLNDDTYVRSVYTVPAGGHLQHSAEGLQLALHWNVFERLNDFSIRYGEQASIDRLEGVLRQNIERYVTDPARTAVALTGGYDSRTNLALLGGRTPDFFYYSYGVADTYDLSIPRQIAQQLGLNYRAILFDEEYRREFNENAQLAIGLGDGIAEANRANYPYAFRKLGAQYDYILTGLFGSELIKHPTSVGNFINQDTKNLLETDQPEPYLDGMLARAAAGGYLDADTLRTYRDELKQRVLTNPFIVNNFPSPIKYFYYLLMVGIRKYFMKEIKVERPFVENLHPFLDLEFVEALLPTPFPWVHHWRGEKNLVKSIKTHRFYVTLIQRNQPKLANILSTHAYTPRHLLNPLTLPVLALQYPYYRRKIRATGSFRSNELVWDFLEQHPAADHSDLFRVPEQLRTASDSKNTIKLASLQHWLKQHLTLNP